jgi:phage regulator Rha-like protein
MKEKVIIASNQIEEKIILLRGQKVLLDRDMAELYDVETKNLNRQVRRNSKRFPPEFVFRITSKEKKELVTKWHRFNSLKHSNTLPFAFTEHGAVMLASVLNSDKAVEASIYVVRAFVRLREILLTHKELAQKMKELELKIETHDGQITVLFETIIQLLTPSEASKRKIGFEVKEKIIGYNAPQN